MKVKNENSVCADIRGASGPLGMQKKKFNVNVLKPYLEPELFEKMVAHAELSGKAIKEVVRKKGSLWVLYDDDTEAEVNSFRDRDTAWEKQRLFRQRSKNNKAKEREKKAKEKEHDKLVKNLFGNKGTKGHKPVSKESLKEMIKTILLKENVLSYIFEQPADVDSIQWDKFLQSLSPESVQADQKLKNIIGNLMKAEAKIVGKAMAIVKTKLQSSGFQIKDVKTAKQTEDNKFRADFIVFMPENQKELPFGLKIENGRPLVFIPDQSRSALNMMSNSESKLLRAELISIQEVDLDNMDDVVNAAQKRDQYLAGIEKKLDKVMHGFSPIEISLMRKLLKQKYKNVA